MEDANKINFAVSGWPGCGSTTLALLLALLFERRYLYIGNIYRYLGQKSGFSNEGSARPKFDGYIEDIIGITIDNYTDYKLQNSNELVLESDIAAFRIGKHPKVFSIFLTAEKNERIKRVELEGRDDASNVLDQRDALLADVYKKLWQIDYYDIDLIERKYNQRLDNSNLSLETELRLIIDQIKVYNSFNNVPESFWNEIDSKIDAYVKLYWDEGKQHLLDILKSKKLLITPEEALTDIAKTFPEDIAQYPENVRDFFLGIN